MKNLTILTIFLFTSFALSGQDLKGIVNSIEKGDLSQVEPLLDDLVDYCFDDYQDLLDKGEFIAKLKGAVSTIDPKSSEIIHSADSTKGGTKYIVAKLIGASGLNYRMYVYTENSKIIEIRFNKE